MKPNPLSGQQGQPHPSRTLPKTRFVPDKQSGRSSSIKQVKPLQQLKTDLEYLATALSIFGGVSSAPAKPESNLPTTTTQLKQMSKEMEQLRLQLDEKDARLRAARSDVLESKAVAENLKMELKASESQRRELEIKLQNAEEELDTTRDELEQLADDFLILFHDNDDLLEAFNLGNRKRLES